MPKMARRPPARTGVAYWESGAAAALLAAAEAALAAAEVAEDPAPPVREAEPEAEAELEALEESALVVRVPQFAFMAVSQSAFCWRLSPAATLHWANHERHIKAGTVCSYLAMTVVTSVPLLHLQLYWRVDYRQVRREGAHSAMETHTGSQLFPLLPMFDWPPQRSTQVLVLASHHVARSVELMALTDRLQQGMTVVTLLDWADAKPAKAEAATMTAE
jgi:hypothetical protein